jgi:uncharacterized protein (TIGR02246 family)
MPMTAREAFERGTETFNTHDLEGFAQVLTDDVVFTAPGGIGGRGRAACLEFYAGWWAAFSDARVAVTDVHFAGDDVAVEQGVFRGTHDGVLRTPGGDLPPTGRRVEVPYIQVLHFREGRHAGFHLAFDRLAMLEQLGLAPAPAPAG